jgi:hypothetical protein
MNNVFMVGFLEKRKSSLIQNLFFQYIPLIFEHIKLGHHKPTTWIAFFSFSLK